MCMRVSSLYVTNVWFVRVYLMDGSNFFAAQSSEDALPIFLEFRARIFYIVQ